MLDVQDSGVPAEATREEPASEQAVELADAQHPQPAEVDAGP